MNWFGGTDFFLVLIREINIVKFKYSDILILRG